MTQLLYFQPESILRTLNWTNPAVWKLCNLQFHISVNIVISTIQALTLTSLVRSERRRGRELWSHQKQPPQARLLPARRLPLLHLPVLALPTLLAKTVMLVRFLLLTLPQLLLQSETFRVAFSMRQPAFIIRNGRTAIVCFAEHWPSLSVFILDLMLRTLGSKLCADSAFGGFGFRRRTDLSSGRTCCTSCRTGPRHTPDNFADVHSLFPMWIPLHAILLAFSTCSSATGAMTWRCPPSIHGHTAAKLGTMASLTRHCLLRVLSMTP